VVEKGIGISYPIGKPNKNKGGYTDGERIPQGTGIDHANIAHEMSDNEFAERMMKAHSNLFHHISRHTSRDA